MSLCCKVCEKNHHTLLHFFPAENKEVLQENRALAAAENCNVPSIKKRSVFRTSRAFMAGPTGELALARVLFESASNRGWIRNALTKALVPIGQETVNIEVFWRRYQQEAI